MSDDTTVLFETDGPVAVITMNRPDRMNAFDDTMHDGLVDAFRRLNTMPDLRAAILTGAGRAFSAGGDVHGMAARSKGPDARHHAFGVPGHARRLLEVMLDVDVPVIGAVGGDAIGLGATLALFCDMQVMAASARIGDPHVRVGIVAGDGGAVIWPMLIGPNRAKDFLLRGRLIDGTEAERLGLVNEVAEAGQVMEKARAMAEDVARMPPLAVRWTKASVNKWIKQQMQSILELSVAYEALSFVTEDHGEAVQAFIDKRRPAFRGR